MTEAHMTGCSQAIIAGIEAAKDDNALDAIHALVAKLARFTHEEATHIAAAFEKRQNEFDQAEMRRRIKCRTDFCALLFSKTPGQTANAA